MKKSGLPIVVSKLKEEFEKNNEPLDVIYRNLRQEYINKLHEHTGRNVVLYQCCQLKPI